MTDELEQVIGDILDRFIKKSLQCTITLKFISAKFGYSPISYIESYNFMIMCVTIATDCWFSHVY